MEFHKEYNAGVNGEDMVDYLLTLVAQQLKVSTAAIWITNFTLYR